MRLKIPELCLVVLVGPSGSGKSTLAARLFKATEVVSSDFCRGLVSDDTNDQTASAAAFEVLHLIVRKRLERGLLTVVDATNVGPELRKPLVALAREFHVFAAAIVLDVSESFCEANNARRSERIVPPHVVRAQRTAMRRSIGGLSSEGFRVVEVLRSPDEVEAIERTRLDNNLRHERGPFDIIGDVHGCFDELLELLADLGWKITEEEGRFSALGPPDRKLVFVGDLVDRGPKSAEVLALVMDLVASGQALCVNGNHEARLVRLLQGRPIKLTHGLDATVASLEPRPKEFRARVLDFLDGLVSHYVLDEGRLVVAHAGLKEAYQGRTSGAVRTFALYGETTGEIDEFGLPVRANWALDYRGAATVVHGHVPVLEAEWLNRTLDIDTGCCFGGKLTALCYPEREVLSVPAHRVYYAPVKPLGGGSARSAQHEADDVLDLSDLMGERHIHTRLHGHVRVPPDRASAIEALSRFAVDPRWLVYLPPTMSPCETSKRPDRLEDPEDAFAAFADQGVESVVCEEKHMGSRAVLVVCRDEATAKRRFGVESGDGAIYTRTGRPFFESAATQQALLDRTRRAMDRAGLWEELGSDWVVLDAELMPWSAKAIALLRQQYAPVGAAAVSTLSASIEVLRRSTSQDISALLERTERRLEAVSRYREAWRRYCWPVQGPEELVLAPFHVLASEGAVHIDRDHAWHMQTLAKLAEEPGFRATPWRVVTLADPEARAEARAWWEALTAEGGEGMVVKPLGFVQRGKRGLIQPAIKVRGPEYLRIIYGPEYLLPGNLERLRSRGLSAKRSLALKEFALGVEALERFVRKEPLRHVHAAVFGVLALETEPVDPRL